MNAPRGFVLLNALILVGALAAVAVLLLARAGEGQARRFADQDTARLRLTLDGGEALMRTALMRDGRSVDHAGEPWARALHNAPLDLGALSVDPADLQGRFNVNWLANPEEEISRAAFARLLQRLGVPASRGEDITRFLTPNSAPDVFGKRVPPIAPAGGPILMIDQLRMLPSLRDTEFDRLAPFISALPGDSQLNVNTASADVLDAVLPGVSRAAWSQLISDRTRDPFTSVEDFQTRLGAIGGFATAGEIDEDRFSVSSDWFEARLTATANSDGSGRKATRITVFERRTLPLGPRVAYRLTQRP
ncbi:type II secretion system minor pseudopilin GspK [Shimia sp. Alg240-R146]|uniref:type II secretion system minor pseudopilin GspK n=1 Tax=Shimia sp. Alg240-R146 TaxID=2993449 RepID=UPI0022DF9E11|nr:type II secretion system minor pseudopilin GspK [Shimia sp. Alg240-R146]